ncbi:MAG: methyltransferase domain-containing protein [Rhodospirillaceae bacterium]|nr:methyltransferase domain-containing protein [Rhodospirillaceae bacterium]
MPDSMMVFDRKAVRRHRDRASATLSTADFLFREAAVRVADRLNDVTRRFGLGLNVGCRHGELVQELGAASKVDHLLQCDFSPRMAMKAAATAPTFAADEEFLPIAEQSLDLVISNLSLHWVNDLPGAMVQLRRALRPDGLFLATLFGGETLKELRACLIEAESQITGGASPRVSPFVDVRDAGGLLNRAGFALPVVDADAITVTYADPLRLLADLRAMGETNAVHERSKRFLRRDVLGRALQLYMDRFADARGRAVATFQIVTLTGWAPHTSQQQALRPGSAKARLADALTTTEIALDEKAPKPT